MAEQPKDLLTAPLHVIIVAGGNGKRVGGPVPKQFLTLQGKPLIEWSASTFNSLDEVAGIVVVVPEDYRQESESLLRAGGVDDKLIGVVSGGSSRQESVAKGLRALPPNTAWVAVHDAARPFVTTQLIRATLTLAEHAGAAIPTVAIHDTLVQVDASNLIVRPISRELVKRSQTPQIFKAEILADAHRQAANEGLLFQDDATLIAHYGYQVATFAHHGENRKITTSQDLEKITMQKSAKLSSIRCGQGFDVHPFADGRPLLLGGVRFANQRGLAGHSDADVICHAVCDAVLGGAALGDIGQHFGPNDPAYEKVSSLTLLEEVAHMVRKRGFEITYIDATLIGEQPRIAGHREEMRENIARHLSIDPECVSVKATTTEGLGFLGHGEGLAANAVATLLLTGEEAR